VSRNQDPQVNVEIWIRNYVNFEDKVGNGENMDFGGNFERAATAIVLTDISMQYRITDSNTVYMRAPWDCILQLFQACSSDLFLYRRPS